MHDDSGDEAVAIRKSHVLALDVHDDETLYCPGADDHDGEYVSRPRRRQLGLLRTIRDDKDFDEIDEGFDIETTIVLLAENRRPYYVTFIACDRAGNCSFYDPDGNDDAVELADRLLLTPS